MLVKSFTREKKKKKKKKKKIMISNFFSGLFLSSRILKGTFASIFVNCQAVSFSPHAWFRVFWSLFG